MNTTTCFSINWSYFHNDDHNNDPIDAIIMFEWYETDREYFVVDILFKGKGYLPNFIHIKNFLDKTGMKYFISEKFNIRKHDNGGIYYEFDYDKET